MPSKVAILLSGAGYLDGSEIHESTLCFLHLCKQGIEYHCFAPNIPQQTVINHINFSLSQEKRNTLEESARIARSEALSLEKLSVESYQALIIPGGLGVYTLAGFQADASKDIGGNALSFLSDKTPLFEEVFQIIKAFHQAKKPLCATCIAPALLARAFSQMQTPSALTLGTAPIFKEVLESIGMQGKLCPASDYLFDDTQQVLTTPAYMEEASIADLDQGIGKMISKLKEII